MSTDKFKDTAFIDIKGLTHFFENIKETELLKYYLNDDINFATNDDILSIFSKAENLEFYFIANEESAIEFNNKLEYSLDDGDWKNWSGNMYLSPNQKIKFRGELSPNKENGIGTFKIYGNVSVHGNPRVLLANNKLVDYSFSNLFNNCTGLTDASELILDSTILKPYCYYRMFFICTELTKAPLKLPAKKAATLCYKEMFMYCINLTKAPEICLNENTTVIENSEEYKSSELIGCLEYMFADCSKLNYIKCHLPSLMYVIMRDSMIVRTIYIASNWVSGVSSTGTFYKKSDANISTGSYGIPNGWEVIDF